jgi:UDP-glucose 4-epimerase
VYGDTVELPKHEGMQTSPRSPYAASKAAGEAYMAAFQAAYGLETVILRYFNVYGPRQNPQSQYAAVVPLFVEALRRGQPVTVHGDGEQTRDFTYVEDVVEALVLAASAPDATQGPMNLGGGGRISINKLVEVVAGALGVKVLAKHAPARVGDVRDSQADIGRARTWLRWEPRTTLRMGIDAIVGALDGASSRPKA